MDYRRFINIVQQRSFLPTHLDSSQICVSPRLSNPCKWYHKPLVSETKSLGILLQFYLSSFFIAHLVAHISSTYRIHLVSLSKPLLFDFDIQVTIIAHVDLLTGLPLFILTSPEYILCISGISQRELINVQIRSHHCPTRALHGFLVQWNEVKTAFYDIQDPMGPSSSTSSHTALIASAPPASFLPQGVCTCCFPCIACSSFSCLHG